MTTSSLDILRCAKLLCDQFGAEADLIAATRADKLLEFGEVEGHLTWMRILRAIVEIRCEASCDGETIH